MSASNQTIVFMASRKKLVRYVFGLVFGALLVSFLFATMLFILLANPNHENPPVGFLVSTCVTAAMWLYMLYETFRAIMRAIHLDVIEISTQEVRLCDWKKSTTYQWSDLSIPEKKKRVAPKGGRVFFLIQIPFLNQERKPIIINTVMYPDGYEEILAALLAARSGTLKYNWEIDQTPRYRNPETPTDRLVGKIVLSILAVLIAVLYFKVFYR
jgi:hypothetical protein